MPIWKGKTYFICAAQKKIFHVFDLVAFASCTTTKRPFGSAFAVSKYREEATTAEEECQLVPFSLLLRVYRVGWNCDIGTTRKKYCCKILKTQSLHVKNFFFYQTKIQ